MARVVYAESAFADFERIYEFYAETQPDLASEVIALIQDAVDVLERHPLVGRGVESGLFEVIISHGRTGFVALYDFLPKYDVVRVLALRHQREAGYPS